MPGIYIHIPFCRKACHYCNFHFSISFKVQEEMVKALVKELIMQTDYLQGQSLETIYFGGGTPSSLSPGAIDDVLQTIFKNYSVIENVEITLEANPDDVHPPNLEAWKASGVNRLSIGVQAFQDELLQSWNRSHTAAQGMESIMMAQEAGIKNITADLIYGAQGLIDGDWITNIQQLMDSGIPHISSYALTVESGTALFHHIHHGKSKAPDDEQANRQYAMLQEMLAANGFMQYEVSNFAKPGFESRHNKSYWSGEHYLGIGPSAHSFNGVSRQWNVSNNTRYIDAISKDVIPCEKEILSEKQLFNEIVMTGLRTSRGIDTERIKLIGEYFQHYLEHTIQSNISKDQIFKNELGNWALKPQYLFFADGIASDLFMVEEVQKTGR